MNEQKPIEQVADELNPYRPEADRYEGWEQGFITASTTPNPNNRCVGR